MMKTYIEVKEASQIMAILCVEHFNKAYVEHI